MAQSIYSILFLEPHTARSTPTSLLKSDAIYKKIFNDQTDLNTYLKVGIIRRQANHLWSDLDDLDLKNKLTNFKFHLSSIYLNFLLRKNSFDQNELQNYKDTEDFKLESNAIANFLSECIDNYLEENANTNLVNIAKQQSFTKYMLDEIKKYNFNA